MPGGSSRRYPPELREWAVRMVAEISAQHDSEWAAISEVARLLGVGCAETVRKWVRQGRVDSGSRSGTTTEESTEVKRLKRENAELRRARVTLNWCADMSGEPVWLARRACQSHRRMVEMSVTVAPPARLGLANGGIHSRRSERA